jgi:uncharacterized repeat protein (TIGR04076 family)
LPEKSVKIIGTVKRVKGMCAAGHKVGDKFELSGHIVGGLCGFFYHDIFPSLIALQYGGRFPWMEDPNTIELECPDKMNAVTLELKRIIID